MLVLLILLLNIIIFGVRSDTTKCCEGVCSAGTEKVFSIVKELGVVGPVRCGESCIRYASTTIISLYTNTIILFSPEDFDKVKKLEPHMEVANVTSPCYEYGYTYHQYHYHHNNYS